jgi:carotenoid 1,2-hydratase
VLRAGGPGFAQPVARDGYAWWYIDALADDGVHGLTIIAFVGSVFSPYYARARARGAGDPTNHCAINVALYGRGVRRWSMTERGRGALARDACTLAIGPSAFEWTGQALTITLDEIAVPWPARIRGTVTLHPTALPVHAVPLDTAGAHRWRPIAPCARIDVALAQPALRWSGPAYWDGNDGDAPLEDAFAHWHWSRATTREGTAVMYDVRRRDGTRGAFGLQCAADGATRTFAVPPDVVLPRSRWGIARATHADAGGRAHVLETLVDAPFYARSLVASRLRGEDVTAMHESLSLDRFRQAWVRMLLPFRMPRH